MRACGIGSAFFDVPDMAGGEGAMIAAQDDPTCRIRP
jgi:hypothetical protein